MSGTTPVPSWSSTLVNRGQRRVPWAALCTELVAWLIRDGREALHSMTPAPTLLLHKDGTFLSPAGDLRTLAQPFTVGKKNRCGLLQSGKAVGVALDVLAELAGQSGYSSACSQGKSK